jgi:uncharacterized protein (DUF488 family)
MTTIYTVGHSNHEIEVFIALLHRHAIELLIDVRSSPFSRYVPQANRESLARALEADGIAYRWMGYRLGGRPQGAVADHDGLRASPPFKQGIADLLAQAAGRPTAIMCSEGDYRHCHRYTLITPALLDLDTRVLHIQPDGSVVDEEEEPRQLALF